MNPPEKIWLSATFPSSFGIVKVISDKRVFDTDIEYHLAPVWHDAKTDPPKEEIAYPARYRNSDIWFQGYWFNGSWHYGVEGGLQECEEQPDLYLVLPGPPKEKRNSVAERMWNEFDGNGKPRVEYLPPLKPPKE